MSDDYVFEGDGIGVVVVNYDDDLVKVSDGAGVDDNDEVDDDDPLEVPDGTEGGAVRLRRQVPQLYGETLKQTSLLCSFTLSMFGLDSLIFIQYISD